MDGWKRQIMRRRVSEDIVLDEREGDRIVDIEILDASEHLSVERLLPVEIQVSPEAA